MFQQVDEAIAQVGSTPEFSMVIVDEGDDDLGRRSSCAWAKYADALARTPLACLGSRFHRSGALDRSVIPVDQYIPGTNL